MTTDYTQILEWFDLYKNSTLEITKEEDGDLDFAVLKLEDADLIKHNDTDDYLSSQAILMRGMGAISTMDGNRELPFDQFEMALTDWWSYQISKNTLYVETERGNYTITVREDGKIPPLLH